MLDTNMVSQIVRGHPAAIVRMTALPLHEICVSAITEGELLFGLERRPDAVRLHRIVREFLMRVTIKPWDSDTAATYGRTRAGLESEGKSLGSLDMLIAAHALQADCVLVTNDRAFLQVADLRIEDWTAQ
ncbi:MAG: type II toxin-antitoxin system VapC family toxin [Aliihoeflea sp.]